MLIDGTVEEIVTSEPGDTLAEAASRAVAHARRRGQPVAFRFAESWLTVSADQAAKDVVLAFTRLAVARARLGR